MIAKIKLYLLDRNNCETLHAVYKMNVSWDFGIDPQAGMTFIIPHKLAEWNPSQEWESFRFYITHIIADSRNKEIILVDKRRIHHNYGAGIGNIKILKKQLESLEWREEKEKE